MCQSRYFCYRHKQSSSCYRTCGRDGDLLLLLLSVSNKTIRFTFLVVVLANRKYISQRLFVTVIILSDSYSIIFIVFLTLYTVCAYFYAAFFGE